MSAVTAAEAAAKETANVFLNQYMTKWAYPTALLFEDGLHFLLETVIVTTNSYHPRTDGCTERSTICYHGSDACCCCHREATRLDLHLWQIEFLYNSMNQATGLTPNEMLIASITPM